jgi:hypothetical protein
MTKKKVGNQGMMRREREARALSLENGKEREIDRD